MPLVFPSVQAREGNRVAWQTCSSWWCSYVFANKRGCDLTVSPSLTHASTHTHTHTLTHTHDAALCPSLSLSHTRAHAHTHTHDAALCPSLSLSLTHAHTHTHTHTQRCDVTLSLSHTDTHTTRKTLHLSSQQQILKLITKHTVADSEAPDCHSKVRITSSPSFTKRSSIKCIVITSGLCCSVVSNLNDS